MNTKTFVQYLVQSNSKMANEPWWTIAICEDLDGATKELANQLKSNYHYQIVQRITVELETVVTCEA